MATHKQSVNLLRRTLLYYFLLVFIIVLALLLVNLFSVSNTTHQSLDQANSEIVHRINQLVDTSLSEIDRRSMLLVTESAVRHIIYDTQTPSYPRAQAIVDLNDTFSQISALHPLVSHVSIYSGIHDKIITRGHYVPREEFADQNWLPYYHAADAHSGWLPARRTKWINLSSLSGGVGDETLVTLMRFYPLGAVAGMQKGAVLLHIKAEDLSALVTRNGRAEDNLLLIDPDGDLVIPNKTFDISRDDLQALDLSLVVQGGRNYVPWRGEDASYRVYAASSSYTGWTCLNFVDESLFSRSLDSFRILLASLALVVLGVGTVGILVISKWSFKPVQEFTSELTSLLADGDKPAKGLTFQEIAVNFADVITDRERMQEQLEESRPTVRWRLLMDILTGTHASFAEVEPSLRFVQADLLPAHYIVLLVRDDENVLYTNLSLHRASMQAVSELVESCVNATCVGCAIHLGEGLTAAICSFVENDAAQNMADVQDISALILDAMQREFQGRIHIGIGRYVKALSEVHRSYRDAMEALQYSVHTDPALPIVRYGDIPAIPANAEYSFYSLIEPICADLRLGEFDKVFQRFAQMKDKMLAVHLPLEKSRRILDMLCVQASATALSRGVPFGDALQMQSMNTRTAIERATDNDTLFEQAESLLAFLQIAIETHAARHADSVTGKQAKQVLAYLQTHYQDPTLSLSTVAEEMNLSASYISRIFRQETGSNFLDTLTRIRIAHAQELLVKPGARVNDVAEQVGYVSIHTFIRAFKKLTGKTPGQWEKPEA